MGHGSWSDMVSGGVQELTELASWWGMVTGGGQ